MKKTAMQAAISLLLTATALSVGIFSSCTVKHTHDYGEWQTVTEASCTQEGMKERECSGCGNKQTQTLPKTAHEAEKWSYTDEKHYKKCKNCGTEFDVSGHTVTNGSCFCGYTEGKAATLSFELTDDGLGYKIVGIDDGTTVEIPQTYEGLPVVEIGYKAFRGSKITSLEIPPSITTLGEQAFAQLTAVREVTLPNTLTTVGNFIFWDSDVESVTVNCDIDCKGAFQECTSLQEVIFGADASIIGLQAFYLCSSLKEVEIPSTVTSCGKYAFYESGLEKVTVGCDLLGGAPLDTKFIFTNCDNLKEAVFTSTAARLSYYAFDNCPSLERYVLEEGYPYFKSVNGIIYSNDLTVCVKAPHGIKGEVTVLNGVTELSGEQPFRDCKNLTRVILPSTLKKINNACFYKSGIKEINIPDQVTEIGKSVFNGCDGLETVYIGAGVTDIDVKAFINCPLLNTITISPQNTKYTSVNGGIVSGYGTSSCTLEIPNKANEIPSCVTAIGSYAFTERDLTSITIPQGVKYIYRGAFDSCENLSSVNLPSTLTYIDSYAFAYTAISSITIPSAVTEISCWAFEGCEYLTGASFSNASGWKVVANGALNSTATAVSVNNPANNATLLTDTYCDYKWFVSA